MIVPLFSRLLLGCLLLASLMSAWANQAVINGDGVLEIDGTKIFPIGFTTSPPPNGKTPQGRNGIAELADAGATFLRAGPLGEPWTEARWTAEREMEDAAAKYGMHCWLNLREAVDLKKNSAEHEALLRKLVTTFRDHPGLGVYKGADEPAWGKMSAAGTDHAYQVVKALDANHPLALIQAPDGVLPDLSNIKRFNSSCDIVGFDVYPIAYPPGRHSQYVKTNSEISMVGDWTKMATEISGGKKSVWMTLQFAWSGVVKKNKTLRFPTFPEQRFMAYEAIINGARGLMYFGGNLTPAMTESDKKLGWAWHYWDQVLRRVVEEIGTKSPLYPALTAPNSKLPVTANGEGIEFCVREAGNDIFVIACNRSHKTEQVKFSGLGSVTGEAPLLFEEPRSVKAISGTFTDWFGPFEVHAYRFTK
ncbi:MAG: hypothetical protein JWO95_527 [Verrucomicrobiales bacterium]|nr:hypothetical protein [Verrucomicrobiales bacterium]